MRVLLDENLPKGLVRLFDPGIEVVTVRDRGWQGTRNGELLRTAQDEFDVLITMDRGIPHQQNLSAFRVGILLLEGPANRMNDLAPLMARVNAALRTIRKGQVVRVTA